MKWSLSVLLLESFDLLNVVNEVSDAVQNREGFGGDDVSEVFFESHGQFNGVEGIESVVFKAAVNGNGLFVSRSEVILDDSDNVS